MRMLTLYTVEVLKGGGDGVRRGRIKDDVDKSGDKVDNGDDDNGATRGVVVSTSASLARHQC